MLDIRFKQHVRKIEMQIKYLFVAVCSALDQRMEQRAKYFLSFLFLRYQLIFQLEHAIASKQPNKQT